MKTIYDHETGKNLPIIKTHKLPGRLPTVIWAEGVEKSHTLSGGNILLKKGLTLKSFTFHHELGHIFVHESSQSALDKLITQARELELFPTFYAYFSSRDLDEFLPNLYALYKVSPEKVKKYPAWLAIVKLLDKMKAKLSKL